MNQHLFSSVTRISDLSHKAFEVIPLPKESWSTGDYVVGEVVDASGLHAVELSNGRMMEAMEGHLVIGAWGKRAATLEAVGDWQAIKGDIFQAMTPAGLFGQVTSASPFIGKLMTLKYSGHVHQQGAKQTMDSMLPTPSADLLTAPIVLVTGTSMSSGKTLSGRTVVRILSKLGFKVIGVKITGAARYRDVLSYRDAGAAAVFDFVDVGLPSTVTEAEDFKLRLEALMHLVAAQKPDVVVAEAGASPLEPYNGKVAMDLLGERVKFNLLCASDPYAVLGVAKAFNRQPDLVAGGAANTTASVALVKALTGLRAMNLLNRDSRQALRAQLLKKLQLGQS